MILFYGKKGKKQFLFIYGNVLEFIFTLEKNEKIGIYNVQKFKTCRWYILEVIRGFHTVCTVIRRMHWPSDWGVTVCIC